MQEEMFQLVDREGRPAGSAARSRCHGDPRLIHAVVHLHVFDGRGRLYLQKRSPDKDLYPGFWDTAVGGHVQAGEPVGEALQREAREELGLRPEGALPLLAYVHSNATETEFVHAFGLVYRGEPAPNPEEITEGRFFTFEEIEAGLGGGLFTPNFEQEYRRLEEGGWLERFRRG